METLIIVPPPLSPPTCGCSNSGIRYKTLTLKLMMVSPSSSVGSFEAPSQLHHHVPYNMFSPTFDRYISLSLSLAFCVSVHGELRRG